ncbi:SulP family inorganic anion transporter [Demequina sediminicola]|uniref:SulP family inorganic anion transporter n=1 Tax=Demequina sediminicola TaxID=1095026 RepID=UPI000AEC3AF3|nr:SulP family inorganic anion transporter [Demequina sediminicola]
MSESRSERTNWKNRKRKKDGLWSQFSRKHLKKDASSGVLLGIESVPDGLANAILAGVNPMAGLYAYMLGLTGGAFFTGTAMMAVGVTGAMALVVADVNLSSYTDPTAALATLTLLTGIVMIIAGVARLGKLVRFVPTAVMTGFVAAVGVNIILGQFENITGVDPDQGNRILDALWTVTHPGDLNWWSTSLGLASIALIVWLSSTRMGPMGMVLAVIIATGVAAALNAWTQGEIALVRDIAEIESGFPPVALPDLTLVASLAVPALSLAFVGLIQGAAVTTNVADPERGPASNSKDFIGQGAGNIASGVFSGMPVGASMSGSTLVAQAGARSRTALLFAAFALAVTVLFLGDAVSAVAMPALAALLVTVGYAAIKPEKVRTVLKTGPIQSTLMIVTFALTLLIPLHLAVLVGVGLGIVMFVSQTSNKLILKRLEVEAGGEIRESAPPQTLEGGSIEVLQPYGSMFFASSPVFDAQLPKVTSDSGGAIVIFRLRGIDQVGLSHIDVLRRYCSSVIGQGGTVKFVLNDANVRQQFERERLVSLVGEDNVYMGSEWLGRATRAAYADARSEIERSQ